MGLGYEMVEAMVREHRYKPIRGEVVMIGKQTIYLTPPQLLALLSEHGIDVTNIAPQSIALDNQTSSRRVPYDKLDLVSDAAFLKLLGVPSIRVLDHSDYEGADIIHDLTQPLPDHLKNRSDFVVDGSTLDNVFDPAQTMKNLADMLKPGGRLLSFNMFSNHHNPYVMLNPLWYLDYFTMNGFSDCKLYIVLYDRDPRQDNPAWEGNMLAGSNSFTINLPMLMDPQQEISTFFSDKEMAVVVLAEKGEQSTSHIIPSQQHYRSPQEWETYRRNLSVIMASLRPHVVRPREDITFHDVRGGHLFMGSDFTARDPSEEIKRCAQEAVQVLPLQEAECAPATSRWGALRKRI